MKPMPNFDINVLQTPYYIVDEALIIKNLEILKSVALRAGCKILLAQKAFSMFCLYPLIGKYLSGTTASGLYEARLGCEHMGGEAHIFSPAYNESEFDEILKLCDHIIFNSLSQWDRFEGKIASSDKSFGLRINPEHSTQDNAIYNPCSFGSRLGITADSFEMRNGVSGLHFHTLCEQNADALISTLYAVEENFGECLSLPQIKWVNFGGGHHITRGDYDVEALINAIISFKEKYNTDVYLEPGEAVALNAGYLVSSVQDIVHNGINIAILDTSAACHMPDVIEMPYRPSIAGASEPGIKTHTYRLGGPTCLAGDIIGDYSFERPLIIGDKLVFFDMAIYSMVKNNTFNGMKLPSIAVVDANKNVKLIKEFGYEDFKMRLS